MYLNCEFKIPIMPIYKVKVIGLKLPKFTTSSKILNRNQMLTNFSPSMHYICMYVCMYVHTNVCIYVYVRMSFCIYVCVYEYMYICNMYIRMYVHMYVGIYLCLSIYLCM